MRTAKILGLVVGSLIALLVIVLLAVWLLVNPNDFKPKIQTAVRQATGRELKLPGDIKLSVFPWIALQLGPASLGNPAGFSDQPFLSIQKAAVRVKLVPLLSKRLEVGRVEIDGLDLKLQKNAAGKGNWEGFGTSGETPSTPPAAPAKPGGTLAGIEGIKVSNARVSYGKITVQNVNLEAGSFAAKRVVPITLHLDADRGVAGEHAGLDVKLDLNADIAAKHFKLDAFNFNSDLTQAGNPRPIRVTLTAPAVDVDLGAQTLNVGAFDMNAAGAHVTGSVQGTRIVDALNLKGSAQLAPLVVREFLPRLGMTAPVTRDPKALSQVAFSSAFTYGGNAARLDGLEMTLDDTHLKGSAGIVNLETNAMQFALAVDKIDLDRYLPPANQPPAPPAKPDEPPAKPLDANGTLAVGSLHVSMLDLTNVQVTVATNDKVLHVFPLKAQVFGGQYSGNITLDSRSATPALSLDEHLTGVDVGKLVAAGSKKVRVTGHGNVNLKATARGAAADPIMKTLNGRFDLNVVDGAVEGMDLGYELGRAEALIRRQPLPNTPNANRTRFDAFKMSADLVNGVASSKDLVISSAVLKVTGQGSANLPAQTLDFSLLADTLRTAGNTPLRIPVKVTGSFTSPTVRPDIDALVKGALKQKAQDLLKEKLQDKLKDLFH